MQNANLRNIESYIKQLLVENGSGAAFEKAFFFLFFFSIEFVFCLLL